MKETNLTGRLLGYALASWVALAGIVAQAGELIVVDARGLALRPGQVIDDSQPLVLREGQRVTLIAANGNTLKLRGPYDQPPAADAGANGANLTQALSTLIAQKQTRTSEVGLVRAGTGPAKLPEAWVLDVSRSGSLCVRDGNPVVFWRPAAGASANLTVTPTDRSWKLSTTWPSGADRLTVPQNFPVHGNHSTYLVGLDQAQVALTLNSIPDSVASDKMRAAWMIEKGCEAQAEALLATLH
jgi:hypothetical protein